MKTEPLRILLVDDHTLFRKGLVSLLQQRKDFLVVGEASDGLLAIKAARSIQPDIILMDIHMPRLNGLEALKQIKEKNPAMRIVMLTVSDDENLLFEAVKSGAEGYLLKSLDPGELFSMLNGLSRGEAPISRILAAKILRQFRQIKDNPSEDNSARCEPLTARETMVLERLVLGETNDQIANVLKISENTVKIHVCHILEKLHLQNRIQAAVYAVRHGLIDEGDAEDFVR